MIRQNGTYFLRIFCVILVKIGENSAYAAPNPKRYDAQRKPRTFPQFARNRYPENKAAPISTNTVSQKCVTHRLFDSVRTMRSNR